MKTGVISRNWTFPVHLCPTAGAAPALQRFHGLTVLCAVSAEAASPREEDFCAGGEEHEVAVGDSEVQYVVF